MVFQATDVLFVVTLMSAVVPYGEVGGKEYPVFSLCNPCVISNVTNYWKTSGTPQGVLRTVSVLLNM